ATAFAHVGRSDNPHNVTKAQLGLGNVDNTTDASKPLSTAQKTYVDNQIASLPPITVKGRFYDRGSLGSEKDVVMIYGWDYTLFETRAEYKDKNITFGMTFKTPPIVVVSTMGYSGGAASVIGGAGPAGEVTLGGIKTNTTGTTIRVRAETGKTVPPNISILYNLIVIGEPA